MPRVVLLPEKEIMMHDRMTDMASSDDHHHQDDDDGHDIPRSSAQRQEFLGRARSRQHKCNVWNVDGDGGDGGDDDYDDDSDHDDDGDLNIIGAVCMSVTKKLNPCIQSMDLVSCF